MTRKAAFDAVANVIPGVWNVPGTIALMNQLCDLVDAQAPQERKVGPDGLELIKRFEGCHKKLPDGRIKAYPDPGTGNLPITIGWGTTRINGKPFDLNKIITQAEADEYLAADLQKYADEVSAAIGDAPTTQKQFDALVSFHYNTGAIGRSTLTKLHNRGQWNAAANEFGKWNKAGVRVLAGLTRRRAAEAALYRSGSQ